MATHEYAPGQTLEAFGGPGRSIVLLWHGRGVDQGAAMHPLASRIASDDTIALAVNWNSEAADLGRSGLLSSLRFARDLASENGLDPDRVVIAGWSLGATAAVGVATHAKRLGVGLGGVIMVAPGDGARVISPITHEPLPQAFPPGAGQCAVDLLYGEDDPLSTPDLVSGLELRLRASGWTTSLHSVNADHEGVVGARFDERTERYLPSRAAKVSVAVDTVASTIVTATSRQA